MSRTTLLRSFAFVFVPALLAPALRSDATEIQEGREWVLRDVMRQLERQSPHPHHDRDTPGTCVTLPDCALLFNGVMTADGFRDYLRRNPGFNFDSYLEPPSYQAQGSIWTSTATDGAVAQGEALTLTYSFLPDGVSINIAGYTPGQSNLIATMNASFPGGFAAFKTKVAAAFARYSQLTNISYAEVTDDGAAFPTAAGALGVRGDVRIGMISLDGGGGGGDVLAVNFFPQFGGDMVLDSTNAATFVTPTGDYRALRNVLMHEHGHGVGLNHVEPADGTKLMEPLLSTGFDGPQEDDVRGLTRLYGDRVEPNEAYGSEHFMGGPLNTVASAGVQLLTLTDVALERTTSKDFYGFTAFAGAPIAIRVTPVGTTYSAGPQGGTPQTIQGKSVRNLGLRLWRRVSAATGQLELFAQIDFNTSGADEYHPPIAYTVAGYMLAEVYSTDGVNDSQRYEIRISNSAIDPIVEKPSMTVFDSQTLAAVDSGDTLLYASTQVGQNRSRTLTIGNGGPGPLQLGSISLAGPNAAEFSFSLIGSATVPPGEARSLAVGFSPSAAGQRVAVLSIPNNDPVQSEFSCILSGTATAAPAANIQVQAGNVTLTDGGTVGNNVFPPGIAGTRQTVSFTLANTGNANLIITPPIQIAGAHAAYYTAQLNKTNIAPGANNAATLSITLDVPADEGGGLYIGQFTINSNDPDTAAFDFQINATVDLLDCNSNGTADPLDISGGASSDCDSNGTPDDCQLDTDGDGTIDVCDLCPLDPNKNAPGVCDCGIADTDSDGDGTPDCNDLCPDNPDKTAPGECACNPTPCDQDDMDTNDFDTNDADTNDANTSDANTSDADTDGNEPPPGEQLTPDGACGAGACGAGVSAMAPALMLMLRGARRRFPVSPTRPR